MPRVRRGLEATPKTQFPELLAELVNELRSSRDAGQPMIEEQYFPRTNAVRVTVIWNKWLPLADEERANTILQAYEQVEGKEFRDRIALAIGLTVPEAYELALLPYYVVPALRKGDKISHEQCTEAMVAHGASLLLTRRHPSCALLLKSRPRRVSNSWSRPCRAASLSGSLGKKSAPLSRMYERNLAQGSSSLTCTARARSRYSLLPGRRTADTCRRSWRRPA